MIVQLLFSNTKIQRQHAFLSTVDIFFQNLSQQYILISQIYHTHLIWPQKYYGINEKKITNCFQHVFCFSASISTLERDGKYFPEK